MRALVWLELSGAAARMRAEPHLFSILLRCINVPDQQPANEADGVTTSQPLLDPKDKIAVVKGFLPVLLPSL